jgi:hypothetical protein
MMLNRGWVTSPVRLLTLHDHLHILDKTVDDLESLDCGSLSLVVRESVEPLQDHLDFLLSQHFLHKFDYVALTQ